MLKLVLLLIFILAKICALEIEDDEDSLSNTPSPLNIQNLILQPTTNSFSANTLSPRFSNSKSKTIKVSVSSSNTKSTVSESKTNTNKATSSKTISLSNLPSLRPSSSPDKSNQKMCFLFLNGSVMEIKTGVFNQIRLAFYYENDKENKNVFIALHHGTMNLRKESGLARHNDYFISVAGRLTGKIAASLWLFREPFSSSCSKEFAGNLKYVYFERYWNNPVLTVCADPCSKVFPNNPKFDPTLCRTIRQKPVDIQWESREDLIKLTEREKQRHRKINLNDFKYILINSSSMEQQK